MSLNRARGRGRRGCAENILLRQMATQDETGDRRTGEQEKEAGEQVADHGFAFESSRGELGDD